MTTEEKLNKVAVFIGTVFGMVKSLDRTEMDENNRDIYDTLERIMRKGINELFYEKEVKE